MIPLRRALWGLGAAGVVLGLAGAALVAGSRMPLNPAVTAACILVLSWAFIATGLFAWYRRPHNRIGALMTAAGFAWLLPTLRFADVPLLFSLGTVVAPVGYGVLVHLLLAYPGGRLRSGAERALVAAGYAVSALATLPGLLFWNTERRLGLLDCADCPANAFLVSDNIELARALERGTQLVALVFIVPVVWLLVQRVRRARGWERRELVPLWWAGAATVFALGVLLGGQALEAPLGVVAGIDLVASVALASVPFGFLIGLLRTRLSRAGAVSELMATLSEAPDRRSVRDALAAALGDPTLRLAFWLPDRDVFVDAEGRPLEPRDRGFTRVELEGRWVGAILHDPALDADPELVVAAGGAAALALEKERLEAELRARVEELRASRARLVEAGYAERRKVERDLHDGAQQRLVSLSLALKLARGRVGRDDEQARELLDAASAELEQALAELRELARGLHPPVLTDHGLDAAVRALASRAPLPVDVAVETDERLPPAVESAAYFVVAEALTNVARYAQAGSASVRVARENGHALVEVRDDGVGGADPGRGSGLRGLGDRVAALDGRLAIDSEPGRGTRLRAEIPGA